MLGWDGNGGRSWSSPFPRSRIWVISKLTGTGSSCDRGVPKERTFAPSVLVRADWIHRSAGCVFTGLLSS